MSDLKTRKEELFKTRQKEFETAPLSRVVEIALADMKRAIEEDKIKINMDYWVRATPKSKNCYACFAGCVMLETYNIRERVTIQEKGGNSFGTGAHFFDITGI